MPEMYRNRSRIDRPNHTIGTAIWLIGLGILFYTGYWWPGIIILIGVSMVVNSLVSADWGNRDQAVIEDIKPYPTEPTDPFSSPLEQPEPAAVETLNQVPELVKDATNGSIRYTGWLPASCPSCGAPVNPAQVVWQGAQTAQCTYCGSPIASKPAV